MKENQKINTNRISIAIPKGYLLDSCLNIFSEAGYNVDSIDKNERKLFYISEKDNIRFVITRPMDVPVYVERGACDLGLAGKDVLAEVGCNVMELLDTKKGRCRLIAATNKNNIEKIKDKYKHFGMVTVATKYQNISRQYFDSKGMQVEIIKLYGSVELAPMLNIADEIVDITATGRSLEQNRLEEVEEIMVSTTRLIANKISYRLKNKRIEEIVKSINKVCR